MAKLEMYLKSNVAYRGEPITLNVGGKRFATTRSTLTKYPNSFLGALLNGLHESSIARDDKGRVFLDRDPKRFSYILNWLRYVKLPKLGHDEQCDFDDELRYYGLFEFAYPEGDTSERSSLPEELQPMFRTIQCHSIHFDPAKLPTNFSIVGDEAQEFIAYNVSNRTWVFGSQQFSSGIHYWSFQIQNRIHDDSIIIGISDPTGTGCPGFGQCHGVGLDLADGLRSYSSTWHRFLDSQQVTTARCIDVYLDMNAKRCRFFADGMRLDGEVGRDVLTSNTYCPVVLMRTKSSASVRCNI